MQRGLLKVLGHGPNPSFCALQVYEPFLIRELCRLLSPVAPMILDSETPFSPGRISERNTSGSGRSSCSLSHALACRLRAPIARPSLSIAAGAVALAVFASPAIGGIGGLAGRGRVAHGLDHTTAATDCARSTNRHHLSPVLCVRLEWRFGVRSLAWSCRVKTGTEVPFQAPARVTGFVREPRTARRASQSERTIRPGQSAAASGVRVSSMIQLVSH